MTQITHLDLEERIPVWGALASARLRKLVGVQVAITADGLTYSGTVVEAGSMGTGQLFATVEGPTRTLRIRTALPYSARDGFIVDLLA